MAAWLELDVIKRKQGLINFGKGFFDGLETCKQIQQTTLSDGFDNQAITFAMDNCFFPLQFPFPGDSQSLVSTVTKQADFSFVWHMPKPMPDCKICQLHL